MSDYDNTNSGAIFRNKKKTNDKHPDFTGSINVNGVEYWVSAWSKFSPKVNGNFLSLAVNPKEAQNAEDPDDMLSPTSKATSVEGEYIPKNNSDKKPSFYDAGEDVPY